MIETLVFPKDAPQLEKLSKQSLGVFVCVNGSDITVETTHSSLMLVVSLNNPTSMQYEKVDADNGYLLKIVSIHR
jgi:hypothetical protein